MNVTSCKLVLYVYLQSIKPIDKFGKVERSQVTVTLQIVKIEETCPILPSRWPLTLELSCCGPLVLNHGL